MKNNSLSKITQKSAIDSLIENTKSENKQVIGWRIVEGKKQTVELYVRVIRSFRNEFILRVRNPEDEALFKKLHVSTESFNVFFPKDLVIFQSKIKSRDPSNGDLVMEYPSMVAQVDRRKSLRYEVEENEELEINILKKFNLINQSQRIFKKQAYDISTGGLSFLVTKSERKFFKEGDHISSVQIELSQKDLDLKTKVVSTLEIKPTKNNSLSYTTYKVALSFEQLDEKTRALIEKYVFEKIDFSKAVS